MRCDKWDRFGRRLIGHRYLLMDPIFCAEKPDAGRRNFWGWKSEKSSLVIEKVERGPQWLVFDQDVQECVYVKGRDESSQVCNQCPSPQHERQPWGRKSIWRRERVRRKTTTTTMACSIGLVCAHTPAQLSCICQFSVSPFVMSREPSKKEANPEVIYRLHTELSAHYSCIMLSECYIFCCGVYIFVLTSGAATCSLCAEWSARHSKTANALCTEWSELPVPVIWPMLPSTPAQGFISCYLFSIFIYANE